MRRGSERIFLVFALIGILMASYAVTLHFSPEGSSICNISETVNCDKVNKSPWAKFFGIPVSILGLFSYLLVFLIMLKKPKVMKSLDFTNGDYWQYMTFITVAMFLFQGYLTMTEVLYIKAYCLVCLISQGCVIILAGISARMWKLTRS